MVCVSRGGDDTDAAEQWLKENDPEYKNRKKLEHSYLSNYSMDHIQRKEIPVSNVYDDFTRRLYDIEEYNKRASG